MNVCFFFKWTKCIDNGDFQQKNRSQFFLKGQMEMLNMKNTTSEIKNSLDRLVNKLDTAEEKMSQPEDRSIEIIHTNIK